jgi:hypothetical protein
MIIRVEWKTVTLHLSTSRGIYTSYKWRFLWFCVPICDTVTSYILTLQLRQPLLTKTAFFLVKRTWQCEVFRVLNRRKPQWNQLFETLLFHTSWTTLHLPFVYRKYDSHVAAHNLLPAFGASDCSVTPCPMTDKSQTAVSHLPRRNQDSGSRCWYQSIRSHTLKNVILISEELQMSTVREYRQQQIVSKSI